MNAYKAIEKCAINPKYISNGKAKGNFSFILGKKNQPKG